MNTFESGLCVSLLLLHRGLLLAHTARHWVLGVFRQSVPRSLSISSYDYLWRFINFHAGFNNGFCVKMMIEEE